jgi:predicted transcriptional regulator
MKETRKGLEMNNDTFKNMDASAKRTLYQGWRHIMATFTENDLEIAEHIIANSQETEDGKLRFEGTIKEAAKEARMECETVKTVFANFTDTGILKEKNQDIYWVNPILKLIKVDPSIWKENE